MKISTEKPSSRSSAQPRKASHIVMHTFGSYGDLHPYMALGLEMQARGHRVTLATSEVYRQKILAEGLGFHPVRPDISYFLTDRLALQRTMDPRKGAEFLLGEVLLPAVRDTRDDLIAIVRGADMFVSHPVTLVGRLVAQQTGVPWVSTVLAPSSVLSAHDAPLFAAMPLLFQAGRLHPMLARAAFALIYRASDRWAGPLRTLYTEQGMALNDHPIFDAQHAPDLALALFSPVLGEAQPDWPSQMRVTGFAFYDRHDGSGLHPELAAFLDAGPPPIVCTLGSAAVSVAGNFYAESAYLGKRSGRRVVLLTGPDPANVPPDLLPGVVAFPYAPFSEIFPRACAIVHQGGVGTTGQALRAGKTQLIMPVAHDQHDNAARVKRLKIGHVIRQRNYTRSKAAGLLLRLLMEPATVKRANEIGQRVRAEEGTRTACDLLEAQLRVL